MNKYSGGNFDDFLAEEGILEEVTERALKRLLAKDYCVEVGKPDPRNGELVIAILESITYLVCTPNRGVLRGMPILIGKSELKDIADFPDEKIREL